MKIEHIAIWAKDLEKMKDFYVKYFDGVAEEKYHNPAKNFESYFINFKSGSRLEIMTRPDVNEANKQACAACFGYTHLAFSVGSKEKVDLLTEKMRAENHFVISEPRTTGDGYYESCIADPEGNLLEITS